MALDLRNRNGPLSDRHKELLQRLGAGESQRAIARDLGLTEAYISGEANLARSRMGCETTAQAVAKYRTHGAYLEAAAFVEAARIPVPLIEADAHVNHVLEGVAALLRERAAGLLPS